MMRWQRNLLFALALLLGSAGIARAQEPTSREDAMKKGREYTAWFMAGEMDKLWPLFSPEMKQALGSEEAFKTFRAQIEDQLGTEERVIDEEVQEANGFRVYTRTAQFSNFDGPIEVIWALAADDTIAGFFIRPKQ